MQGETALCRVCGLSLGLRADVAGWRSDVKAVRLVCQISISPASSTKNAVNNFFQARSKMKFSMRRQCYTKDTAYVKRLQAATFHLRHCDPQNAGNVRPWEPESGCATVREWRSALRTEWRRLAGALPIFFHSAASRDARAAVSAIRCPPAAVQALRSLPQFSRHPGLGRRAAGLPIQTLRS